MDEKVELIKSADWIKEEVNSINFRTKEYALSQGRGDDSVSILRKGL